MVPQWTIGGTPVTTAKADANSVIHQWDLGGSSVTTCGLRFIANTGTYRVDFRDFPLEKTETF